MPDGTPETIPEPLIPLLDTTLLTNAPGEPRVGNQLLTEIHSADRIDVVMAFIRRSGIAPLLDALRAHCERGRPLRVLTTTYTGSTEARALDALRGARRRRPRLLRHDAPRGCTRRRGCFTALGLLDRVHRLVEPHALGAGQRPRVERARVRRAQPRRRRQGRGRLRELLEQRRLRALRRGRVRSAAETAASTRPDGHC